MEEELLQTAALDEYKSQDQEELEGQASHWAECYSDNGKRYFTNMVTGETSWSKPGSDYEQAGSWLDDGSVEFNAAEISDNGAVILRQDTAPNESSEVTQWLELYDQENQAMYYFSPQSDEMRWKPPLEAADLVRTCDSDAALRAVVSLQYAAWSQQARGRVTAMRQQKMVNKLEDSSIDNETRRQDEHVELNGGVHTDAAPSSTEEAAPPVNNSQWVEVFDPATQQLYYYSPRTSETRWDPPETFVSSLEDRKVAAAISIQSLSRGRIARKQVNELRGNSRQHHKQHSFQDEYERETICCREMRHQELLQIESGDQFWGLDNYERERQAEEERTKALLSTNEIRTSLDCLDFEDEEVDPERLKREQQEEDNARIEMYCEETLQCQNEDSFWGIEAEETRQHAANFAMAQEEAASRRFAEGVLDQALSATWEAEVQHNASKQLASRGGHEQRTQARYLRWFYQQCVSVDELLDYRWPTKQQQDCLCESMSPVKRRRHPVVRSEPESVASVTPYPLDDLVFRDRLEHGDLRYGLRSILTVHHQSGRGTTGTHYEITKASPECAFDEATAAALLKSQSLEYSPSNDSFNGFERQDDCTGDTSQEEELFSVYSVNYRRSRTPDPHIPARFNGVPYKSNQISLTREILSGDHRKLNQLPSLAKHKPLESPKLRHLQKAKTKAHTKPKSSSPVTQQSPNNTNDSARASEDDHTEDDGPQAQFRRQEHEVLSKLFSLMDLDGSGTVNQNEMRWALQRDAEIHALATTSPLLRILLKQRTRLEALFSNRVTNEHPSTDMYDADSSSNELSWDEFLARCEDSYLRLMSEGLLQPDDVTENRGRGSHTKTAKDFKNSHQDERPQSSARETEARTIRRVFALLDNDGNGVVDVAEVQRTLYNSTATTQKSSSESGVFNELRALVESSNALQPMLHQELFMTAFTKFEPMDPRGINEEEFVAFCLEIAQVAAANNMVVA